MLQNYPERLDSYRRLENYLLLMPYVLRIIISCILIYATVIMCGEVRISLIYRNWLYHKKIVQMISGSGFRDHTDPLFTTLSLIKFVDLNKFMLGKFMFRCHIDDVPHIFEGYFPRSRISMIMEQGQMVGCMQNMLDQPLVKPLFHIENPLFGIWLSTLVSILMFQKQFLLNHWRNALWMVHFKS